MSYFEEADEELLELAREVQGKYHAHLLMARFGFAFRSKAPTQRGSVVLASVSVVSPRVHVHLELDFLMWVALPEWERMSRARRVALLDHEFCHCGEKADGGWVMVDHDVQEFIGIIERHGFWTFNLRRLEKVVQNCLPGLESVGGGAVVAAPLSAFEGG